MSTYKGEVRVQASYVLPAPLRGSPITGNYARYAFQCIDSFPAANDGIAVTYTIIVSVDESSYGGLPTLEYKASVFLGINDGGRIFSSFVPPNIYLATTLFATDGTDGTEFGGDQLLSVVKDTVTGDVTFTHPLGVTTVNLNTLGVPALKVAEAMYPFEMALDFRDTDLINDQYDQTFWMGFWGSLGGTRIMGAPLSSAAPGTWNPWVPYRVVTVTPPILTQLQAASHYEATIEDPNPTVYTQNSVAYGRVWTGGIALAFMGEVDMTQSDEHGLIFRVYTASDDADTIHFSRTGDNGATWTERVVWTGDVVEGVPSFPRALNIAWFEPKLTVVWSDGESVYYSISTDLGNNWEDPALLTVVTPGFTAVRPRVIVHPDHGFIYFFYIHAETGDLYVQRSGLNPPLFFLDDTGTVLDTPVDTEYIDAWVDAKGFVRVAYKIVSSLDFLTASPDTGSNYEVDGAFGWLDTGGLWRSVYALSDGLSYHVYNLKGADTINAYASATGGTLPTPGIISTLVDTAVEDQIPALARRPDNGIMLGYFNSAGILTHVSTKDRAVDFS